jgi:glycosyltransferase involved in cell wall biosynthesis
VTDEATGAAGRSPRVLYVVYWGAAEPLGRSLVLPSVRRLSQLGVELTLLSFEKPHDLANQAEARRTRELLAREGIAWVPLRYHKTPKWPATFGDACAALVASVRLHRKRPFDVVHARTFVGGAMGLIVSRALRLPLVFHNEGFYPDEQVDGGIWPRGSLSHRLAKSLEGRLYDTAAAIVVLSQRARLALLTRPRVRDHGTPILVVPSCVDLAHFSPRPAGPTNAAASLRLVYVGSTGGRYRFDQVGPFAVAAKRLVPRVYVGVYTATPPDVVGAQLLAAGLGPDEFSCQYLPHEQMSDEIPRHHAGLFLFTRGLSEFGCSPTKIAEYWASGLPVVTTRNVSDTEEIVTRERVGVLVDDLTPEAFTRAIEELLLLLRDPALPARCRRAAERHYDLDAACQQQALLYRTLANKVPSAVPVP